MVKKENLVNGLLSRELGLKSYKKISQLPSDLFKRVDAKLGGIPTLLKDLENAYRECNTKVVTSCLHTLHRKTAELGTPQFDNNRNFFMSSDGHVIVLKILLDPYMGKKSRDQSSSSVDSTKEYNKIRNQCLSILREVSYTNLVLANRISSDNNLIIFLFGLLSNHHLFDPTVSLLEEILPTRSSPFDLGSVPQFYNLLNGFSKTELGLFCRVVAMLVFDPEDREKMEHEAASLELLYMRGKERILGRGIRTVDRNHALLIGFRDFLPRLLYLLRSSTDPDSIVQQSLFRFPFESIGSVLSFAAGNENADRWTDADLAIPADTAVIETPHPHPVSFWQMLLNNITNGLTNLANLANVTHTNQLATLTNPTSVNNEEEENHSDIDDEDNENESDNENENETESENEFGVEGIMGALNGALNGNGNNMLNEEDENAQNSIQSMAICTYQVELLFVIYAILSGKRRSELQQRLANIGFIYTITKIFDTIDWKKSPEVSHERIHGPGCECNPEMALRVQLLRLLLNFTDGDPDQKSHKRQMLSSKEIQILYSTNINSNINNNNNINNNKTYTSSPLVTPSSSSSPNISPHYYPPLPSQKHEQGLLARLLTLYFSLSPDQPLRFWVSSCIESSLRCNDPEVQIFVFRHGLLHFLIKEIVKHDSLNTSNNNNSNNTNNNSSNSSQNLPLGTLQTSFDLLGEVMRWNRNIFIEFNKIVNEEEDLFPKFAKAVVDHLIDSNVFLRAVILSVERFRVEDKNQSNPRLLYPFQNCHLSNFLSQQHYTILRDLTTIITINDLNQENICCVNTAMVFLVLARRCSTKSPFLTRDRETSSDVSFLADCLSKFEIEGEKTGRPGFIGENFRQLLWYWREYYAQHGRDCLSLELTSRIRATEWEETYSELMENMGGKEMADKAIINLQNKMEEMKKHKGPRRHQHSHGHSQDSSE
eukprot:TRINITY_DN6059_c0_g1_i1.p1 TRINITY_DN6059_c0_g1~~TRINITY_DN6059_c0_g1_i1.p1  ORF type:complete len:940 (+),score=211.94 TRINITY_DN6059_c0_g1_i1:135-2954(+)